MLAIAQFIKRNKLSKAEVANSQAQIALIAL